jgi:hypothetical protein
MENKIILYSTALGNIKINVMYQNENFWLTQKAIATLFGVEVPAISKHLANIYETGELQKQATISILETVQQEGTRSVKRNVEFYIISMLYSGWI